MKVTAFLLHIFLIKYLIKLTESLLLKINLPLKYHIFSHFHNFLYAFSPFNYRKETCYRNPIYIIYEPYQYIDITF